MGVTPAGLQAMKAELIALAGQDRLFRPDAFPAPDSGSEENCLLYRLAEDEDHRFALYLQACRPGLDVPPHNHTTWAVIVGLEGVEENRFYQRHPEGPEERGRKAVSRGEGVAFLPEELHSIHIHGDRPVFNFHMYGRALEQLDSREYWSAKAQAWKVFPVQSGILDRRAG